jgi:hypothetical protein
MTSSITRSAAAIVTGTLVLAGAMPALGQFGTIFEPPRPPTEVPGRQPGRPQPPPAQTWQAPQAREAPTGTAQPGGIQAQPLPPPPGLEPRQSNFPPAAGQPPLAGLPSDQRQPRGAPPQPGNVAPQPGDEVVTELPSQKIINPTAVFSGLDKITGRIISFDVAINETVQFGALQVTPRACYTRPTTETPNTDAFVEVQEITLQGEVRRIFGGWMFAASPGLHAVEHPIYDVWLTDCKGGTPPPPAVAVSAPPPAPVQPAAPAAPQRPRR